MVGRQLPTAGGITYRIKGLLDEIPHRRLIRGVFDHTPEDEENLVKFLHRYEAEYHCRDIVLTPQDQRALAKTTRKVILSHIPCHLY